MQFYLILKILFKIKYDNDKQIVNKNVDDLKSEIEKIKKSNSTISNSSYNNNKKSGNVGELQILIEWK